MPFTIDANEKHVAAGTYNGGLLSVEVIPITSSFGTKDMRKWTFLLEVDGKQVTIDGLSSQNTGPQSKSYRWLSALLGRALKTGESIDDPIGKKALIVVGDNAKGYSEVKDLLPFKEPEQVVAGIPR